MNPVISNDNKILGWDSIPHPRNTVRDCHCPPPPTARTTFHSRRWGVRSCPSREEEEREVVRTELQVSGTATQARDLNFFWAASVLFWDRVNCWVVVTCRKWLHGSNLSNPCLSRDATFVPLLKISPYSEIQASKYIRQGHRAALDWTSLGPFVNLYSLWDCKIIYYFHAALVIDQLTCLQE